MAPVAGVVARAMAVFCRSTDGAWRYGGATCRANGAAFSRTPFPGATRVSLSGPVSRDVWYSAGVPA